MKETPKDPPRLTIDELFDLVALFFSCRGTCNRLRTATAIRDTDKIFIAAGYNGSPAGAVHCDEPDIGHKMVEGHCLRTNHGEENAILNCLDLSRIEGGVATIIGTPCLPCARKLISKKIKKLRYIGDYHGSIGGEQVADLCKEMGTELECVSREKVLMTLQKALNFLQGPGGMFKEMPKIKIITEEPQ